MPELLWTDAHYDAPTLPPPRPHSASSTRIEVPRPGRTSAAHGESATRLKVPVKTALPSPLPAPRLFDPRASAALPLTKRADVDDDMVISHKPSAESWSAGSSTTMWIRETRALPLLRPLDRIVILMTQALPLVRINDSERLERRAVAERVAIIVVGGMALVMTMLAMASALTRLG